MTPEKQQALQEHIQAIAKILIEIYAYWFHLMENLYKVGGSLKRLKKAKNLLWKGLVEETIALFTDCRGKQAQNFCGYLNKHRGRIINYQYHQESGNLFHWFWVS